MSPRDKIILGNQKKKKREERRFQGTNENGENPSPRNKWGGGVGDQTKK